MIPLFSTEVLRNADAYASDCLGIPSLILMENAAYRTFLEIQKILRGKFKGRFPSVLILCGKGNNGGDGYALARHFLEAGLHVKILSVSNDKLQGSALTNQSIIKNLEGHSFPVEMIQYAGHDSFPEKPDVLIDSLLGTGLSGNLQEPYLSIVKWANGLNAFKIAIDVPTGLMSSGTVFKADVTFTLGEFKDCLFYGTGYSHAGTVKKISIGPLSSYYESQVTGTYLIEPKDASSGLPERAKDTNKYSSGTVLCIAGSGRYPHAGVMVSESAYASGAGAVFLAFPESIRGIALTKLKYPVLIPYEDACSECLNAESLDEIKSFIKRSNSIAIGSGLGRAQATMEAVRNILRLYPDKKFVIDADAVYSLKNGFYKEIDLTGKVLTPHIGEFSTMIGLSSEEVSGDILNIGRRFSMDTGAILVLKGAPTILFDPSGNAFINSAGNSGMAKFGSGDVLTGMIAGFLAQDKKNEVLKKTMAAVFLHSSSADIARKRKTCYVLSPDDIIENLPMGIKKLK